MIAAVPPTPAPFVVGERYACESRRPDRSLSVGIGRRDVVAGHAVVSVTIFIAGATAVPEIGHAPFAEDMLRASCHTRTAARAPLSFGFEEGYRTWRKAKGGWFTVRVEEAVDHVLSMLPPRGEAGR